jgi:DNA-binding Xre family transcriptional regulator
MKSSLLVNKVSKNIRKLHKTTFEALASKAGIPYSTLEKILFLQVKDIKLSTIIAISKALHVKVDDLIR